MTRTTEQAAAAIEAKIREALAALEEVEHCAQEAARKEAAYKCEYAKALLKSEHKTVAMREAEADVETEGARLDFYLARNLFQSAVEASRTKRGAMSAMQTIGRALGEEMSFERTTPETPQWTVGDEGDPPWMPDIDFHEPVELEEPLF